MKSADGSTRAEKAVSFSKVTEETIVMYAYHLPRLIIVRVSFQWGVEEPPF